MAKTLPLNFPIPAESAIATYSFADIAEGSGIIPFNLLKVDTGSGVYDFLMTTNSNMYGADSGIVRNTELPVDFDIAFNQSKTIKGNLYAAFALGVFRAGAAATISITATIKKVSGVTETTIGSAVTSATISNGSSASPVSNFAVLKWSITEVDFKGGDLLRVTTSITLTGSGATGAIGCSPNGGQSTATGEFFNTTGSSRSTLFVPFKIQF